MNLGSSIILVKYFGLAGIFMGTTISTVLFPLWIQSRLVYNKIFEKHVVHYFKRYILYMGITIATGILTTKICNILVTDISFINLVFKGLICTIIPNLLYMVVFFKTEEFKYILNILRPMLAKLIRQKNYVIEN